MPKIIKENIVKNIIVIFVALLLLPLLRDSLSHITYEQTNDFLLVISMLLVTVCFANFAFTYEKSRLHSTAEKILSYATTGIFMLLTALLLESMVIAVQVVYPFFFGIIFWFAVVLYLGIILYDMWDILRSE